MFSADLYLMCLLYVFFFICICIFSFNIIYIYINKDLVLEGSRSFGSKNRGHSQVPGIHLHL